MVKSKKPTKKRKSKKNSKKWIKIIEFNHSIIKKLKSLFSKMKI